MTQRPMRATYTANFVQIQHGTGVKHLLSGEFCLLTRRDLRSARFALDWAEFLELKYQTKQSRKELHRDYTTFVEGSGKQCNPAQRQVPPDLRRPRTPPKRNGPDTSILLAS